MNSNEWHKLSKVGKVLQLLTKIEGKILFNEGLTTNDENEILGDIKKISSIIMSEVDDSPKNRKTFNLDRVSK